jgi:transketolase
MDFLHEKKVKFLEELAIKLREDVISIVSRAGSGHIAGPLDMAEIFATLYFHVLNHNPKDPSWPDRDRVVLSNGHICPILYATLARAGYFPKEELLTLRKLGSRLQGHPHRGTLPGIETTSGPLGSGLSQACGMALAAKLDNKKYRIYCLMSDAEQQEGNIWEAVMFASKYKLSNITAIIDRNNIQIDGFTEDVMPLEPLKAKYESFGWNVIEINGHDIYQIYSAIAESWAIFEKPTVIIAHTIAGKGVSFMEKDYFWHSRSFKPGEAEKALKELRSLRGKIHGEHE